MKLKGFVILYWFILMIRIEIDPISVRSTTVKECIPSVEEVENFSVYRGIRVAEYGWKTVRLLTGKAAKIEFHFFNRSACTYQCMIGG